MAVYQISRIQVRRGQANSGTGLPQLASGEMAWAIDTQQLYIGSGAVSEGAPAVSNIRVLTAQDLGLQGNLLGLAQYVYGSSNSSIITGPNANSPVGRTVNTRLDDQITTANFGTLADGATDDTAALQRAINQLFLNPSQVSWQNTNSAVKTRAVLTMPPGNYYTSDTLYIPSYTNLVGAGIDKTIINYHPKQYSISGTSTYNNAILTTTVASSTYVGYIVTCPASPTAIPNNTTVTGFTAGVSLTLSNNAAAGLSGATFVLTSPKPAVQFVNDNSTAGSPDPVAASTTTQARKIRITDLTISTATGLNTLMQCNSVRESRFENIGLNGYNSQTPFSGIINNNSIGIALNSPISAQTQDNIFRNIRATGLTYGVYSYQDITHYCELANNLFENCYFANSLMGFFLGNGYVYNIGTSPTGPVQTQIVNNKFYYIQQEAIYIAAGTGTTVQNCKYTYVGNNGGTNLVSTYPQVYFATYGNLSVGDISDRDTNLANPNTSSNPTFALIPYVPVVSGHGTYSYTGNSSLSLNYTVSATQIFKLPLTWLSSQTVPKATLFSTVSPAGPTGQIIYSVPYVYASNKNFTRQGILTIKADAANQQLQLSDEYNFAGADASPNTTSSIATNLDFQAQFLDKNGVLTSISSLAPFSIVVTYINTLSSDSGTFSYTYNSVF
jgi:Pectate lyase superfamily protein